MSELGLGSKTRIILFVHDFAEGLAFYEDALGLPLAYPAAHGWAEFATGGDCAVCLHDGRMSSMSTQKVTVFGWPVEDLDAAVAALRAKGVEVDDPHVVTEGTRAAEFRDPSGNSLFFEGA